MHRRSLRRQPAIMRLQMSESSRQAWCSPPACPTSPPLLRRKPQEVGIVVVGMGTIVAEMTKKTPRPMSSCCVQLMTTLS